MKLWQVELDSECILTSPRPDGLMSDERTLEKSSLWIVSETGDGAVRLGKERLLGKRFRTFAGSERTVKTVELVGLICKGRVDAIDKAEEMVRERSKP